jgi:glycine cleavage system H lipoate-binding protein
MMVAALVLATFVIFVLVDFYFQRRRSQPAQAVMVTQRAGREGFPLTVVGGFELPAPLSYHPGHTWAVTEARSTVRAGLDDFAARLLGPVDRVELPARGHWLRQGEKAWALVRGEHRFEMLSPIEGEVIDVNDLVLKDPMIVNRSPYGAGWLVAVHSPAAEANLKNLIRGRVAERWMEESVATLYSQINGEAGVHLQDGGRAIPDIIGQVPEERWDEVVHEMFLD